MSTDLSTTNEVLGLDEIKRRFPDEWVLVKDPELDEGLALVRGPVYWHGAKQQECYAALKAAGKGDFAIEFTGEPPADRYYLL